MKIKYVGKKCNKYSPEGVYTLDYEFESEVITCTYQDDDQTITDTFDFSNFTESDELAEVNTDIPVKVIKSAERVDGEMQVVLFKTYNMNKKERIEKYGYGNLPFSTDWQVV